MPKIDTAQLKPANDAVQAARGEMQDANDEIVHLERKHPLDVDKIRQVRDELDAARGRYMTALFGLSVIVDEQIKRAEQTTQ